MCGTRAKVLKVLIDLPDLPDMFESEIVSVNPYQSPDSEELDALISFRSRDLTRAYNNPKDIEQQHLEGTPH